MADPHIVEPLSTFDRATVRMYRAGLTLQAVALVASALFADASWLWWGYAGAVMLSAWTMHLYARGVRFVLHGVVWVGLWLLASPMALSPEVAYWVHRAGLGLLFVATSGWALKERHCFRVPGMRAVPLLLAGSLWPIFWRQGEPDPLFLVPSGIMLLVLSVAKWRMPLHYDIGDKRAYEV